MFGDSGLIMLANEGVQIQSYYVPALGNAPKWCSFLEKITEELEEKRKSKDLNGMMLIVKKQKKLVCFINKVEKNELQEEIIRKMAPNFYLDVNKQIENIKSPSLYVYTVIVCSIFLG